MNLALLEEIETFCRDTWQYLIPDEPATREHLRAICAHTLLFERHFLMLYKDYLLRQFHTTNQKQLNHAFWVQDHSPLASDGSFSDVLYWLGDVSPGPSEACFPEERWEHRSLLLLLAEQVQHLSELANLSPLPSLDWEEAIELT